jgi:hypothetical protein
MKARDLKAAGSISVRTFMWNSMKTNLTEETVQVFGKRSDVDVVATCMTEGAPEKGIHEILANQGLADDWLHIAYGRHTGVAGGNMNAQILSVFLRQPKKGEKYVVDPPVKPEWKYGMDWTVAGMMQDEIMGPATVVGVVDAKTSLHQTSSTGKGGASAMLSFHETANRKATNLAIICAHLDSEDRDKRRKDVAHLLQETALGARVEKVDKSVLRSVLEKPCLIWDSQREECSGKAHFSEQQDIDAVFLMGDLNFRLQYVKEQDQSVAPFPADINKPTDGEVDLADLISDMDERKKIFIDDPLNPKGTSAEALVKDSPDGFAFQCNYPATLLPTYKRAKPEVCASLASKLWDCKKIPPPSHFGSVHASDDVRFDEVRFNSWRETLKKWQEDAGMTSDNDCSQEEIRRLTKECFTDKNEWKLKREPKQDVKRRFLQLGWLDRLCYRAVDAGIHFETLEVVPWDEHPYGDHSPVEMVISISHAKAECQAGTYSNIKHEQSANVTVVSTKAVDGLHWMKHDGIPLGKEAALATCPEGYRFNIFPDGYTATTPQDEFKLNCNKVPPACSAHEKCQHLPETLCCPSADGSFNECCPSNQGMLEAQGSKATIENLHCLKYCGEPDTPQKARREDHQPLWGTGAEHPDGSYYVEGASSTFTCEDGYELSGDAEWMCGANGKYSMKKTKEMKELRIRGPEDAGTKTSGLGNLKCVRTCGTMSEVQARLGVNGDAKLTRSSTHVITRTDQEFEKKVLEGDKLSFTCEETSLVGGSQEVTCLPSGEYSGKIPRCIAKCGEPLHGSTLQFEVTHAGGTTTKDIFEGDTVKYSCTGNTQLIGFETAKCGKDSQYHAEDESLDPPRCVGICKMPRQPRYMTVSFREKKLFTEHKLVIPEEHVIEGTRIQYSCKTGCIQIGGNALNQKGSGLADIECQANGEFNVEPPRCVCNVDMKINDIKFTNFQDKDKLANQLKIKLFPFKYKDSLSRHSKSYDQKSYKKIGMDELPTTLSLTQDLNQYFLHLQVCESSSMNWLKFRKSRCKSLARSDSGSGEVEEDDAEENKSEWDELMFEDAAPMNCDKCIASLVRKYYGTFDEGKDSTGAPGVLKVKLPMYGKDISEGLAEVSLSLFWT